MRTKNERGLTLQQENFALAVAGGKSLSDAYRSAYKAGKMAAETVNKRASELMANGEIAGRVAGLAKKVEEKFVVNTEKLLREATRLAHSDIAGIMHSNGRVKLPHELDADTRAAVASFKIDEYGRIEYKFWDKNSAIERLFKHKGLFEIDNKQKTDPLDNLLKTLGGNVLGPGRGVLPLPAADDE